MKSVKLLVAPIVLLPLAALAQTTPANPRDQYDPSKKTTFDNMMTGVEAAMERGEPGATGAAAANSATTYYNMYKAQQEKKAEPKKTGPVQASEQ